MHSADNRKILGSTPSYPTIQEVIFTYKYVKKSRTLRKKDMVYVMGGKCKQCGYDKCIDALDFHHIIPEEKEFNFNKASSFSWEKIESELKKCIILCSNCHREIHAQGIDNSLKSSFSEERAMEVRNRINDIKHHKIKRCLYCGCVISANSISCANCFHKNERKVVHPSRDDLKERIRNTSFSALSREYGVSDNAIRKWCRCYGLPDKVSDIMQISEKEWDSI